MLDNFSIFASAAAEQSGMVSDLVNTFGINLKMMLVQAINFGLLMVVIYKFAVKPVNEKAEERRQQIADGLKYAEEMKQKLTEAEKQQAEVLREASLQAQELLQDARIQAKELLERETQAATAKVETMFEKGREATEMERQKILAETRSEIARLVVMTSAKVLQSELSDAQKDAFAKAAGKELSSVN
ncbi:MAG: F0F1 ATP synthase subunit B [Opitutales bacterium]|nr:F0F1 ATP synthase subunit B [Opitutales bacterium]